MGVLAARRAHRTLRKTLTLAAALAVTMTMAVAISPARADAAAACGPSSGPFPDLTSANEHCANIAWLKAQGITKPADGKYHPASDVNRGAMAALLFRLTHPGESAPVCTTRPFPDVPTSNVFCGYIKWAFDNHIAFGYKDESYRPNDPVTRGAMAAYLSRVVTGRPAAACTAKPADDVAKTDEFCGVISWMVRYGITYGVGCGYFGPGWPVSRQAMASFLHRAMSVLNDPTAAPTGATTVKRTSGCTPPTPPGTPAADSGSGSGSAGSGSGSGSSGGSSTQPARTDKCPATARACVDLTHDQTWLQRDGKIVYGPVPITSGKPGYRTRPGNWTVYWKHKDHVSSIYHAPMPNAIFFDGGIAFHQGSLSVLSHGCIHLSWAASEKYWDFLRYGDTVSVFGYAPY